MNSFIIGTSLGGELRIERRELRSRAEGPEGKSEERRGKREEGRGKSAFAAERQKESDV
ncbi:hypothetical protein [Dialister sp.]|uniref:hypothetical protein n=1 Tax=Dialister sp. TaxID=1955814 RepID=UPI0025EB2E7A|nr:hypothetical protein [Dialister sp.]